MPPLGPGRGWASHEGNGCYHYQLSQGNKGEVEEKGERGREREKEGEGKEEEERRGGEGKEEERRGRKEGREGKGSIDEGKEE